jgi:predicted GIY-YIG superfamily endonuclease
MEKYYHVYVLIQGWRPVYVGCTHNLKTRIKDHRKDKVFDEYKVVFFCGFKKVAMTYEKAMIDFLVKTANYPVYNKQKNFCPFDGQVFKNTSKREYIKKSA